ncbi:MAG: hypothetical protein WB683_02965 [Candidatus Sulfotelmatobacter sp.]
MKKRDVANLAMMVAAILISPMLLSAQDMPMGDVARQARAEKSQAPHANKVVTDEDLGPHLAPVAETDDPAQVVNRARRAWMTDMPRTCHELGSNNSGPGSSVESLREISAPDRTRIVVDRRGGSDPGHIELIAIGSDMYSRNGTGPWRKDSPVGSPAEISHWLPEAMMGEYATGDLKLVRRDAIVGSPTFLYETKFHPGGVAFRDRTIDFWVGANDNLLRKIDTVTKETAPFGGGIEDRNTITCSYGSVREIKPPI